MARQSYLKNAAILTGTGLLLRAAGMFFRIYIAARIGAEGMGLYQLIYTVYTMAVTLATAGLSVAATRLSAELLATDDPANVRAAMRRTLALGLGLGAAAAALLFTGAGLAADWWLEDARAALSLRILAPSLPFMAVSACLRGFFMARRKVGPNSRAQIFEQVVRIGVVALLIDSAVPQGIGTACAAVVVGNTVSEAASWVYMEWCYRRELRDVPRNAKRPVQGLGRQLWDIIAPIAANQYMTSVLRTVENVMVPGCLALYTLSRETALSQYGALKGMAMPVIFFPFSFLATLSTLLLPEITEAHVQNRRAALEHLVNRVMLITLVLSFLAGGLFTQFAKEIGLVLYQSEEIGFYLSILGPLMPFMYMESMVDGILKGLGEQLSSYYNIFTVEGTAASRVFFRIVAKAVRMRESWPDVHLQGPLRPYESQSASLSFAAFDLCRLSRLVRRNCAKFCFRLKPKAARALFLLPLPTKSLILQGPRVCARVIK